MLEIYKLEIYIKDLLNQILIKTNISENKQFVTKPLG